MGTKQGDRADEPEPQPRDEIEAPRIYEGAEWRERLSHYAAEMLEKARMADRVADAAIEARENIRREAGLLAGYACWPSPQSDAIEGLLREREASSAPEPVDQVPRRREPERNGHEEPAPKASLTMTLREVAAALGISERTVKRHVDAVPGFPQPLSRPEGGRWLFGRAVIERWLDANPKRRR